MKPYLILPTILMTTLAILTMLVVLRSSFTKMRGLPMAAAFSSAAPSCSRTAFGIHRLFSTSNDGDSPGLPYPSLEQLSKDPFMKQVQYGAQMVPMFYEMKPNASANSSDEPSYVEQALQKRLSAQLSHSDGIRGFFVSYLTVEGDSPADWEEVPAYLVRAMSEADGSDLVPLACMNVIMPVAMTTMHEDPNLQAQSALTGTRGVRILEALGNQPGDNASTVLDNCRAIYTVATEGGESSSSVGAKDDLIKYWTDFFEKWGYKEAQKADIGSTMRTLLDRLQ